MVRQQFALGCGHGFGLTVVCPIGSSRQLCLSVDFGRVGTRVQRVVDTVAVKIGVAFKKSTVVVAHAKVVNAVTVRISNSVGPEFRVAGI